jgi:sortase (surface protein transpeptidase)
VAAGASAYMQSESSAEQSRNQKKAAEMQAQAEQAQGESARKNARLKAQRHLNAQASKAGGAGVVAGEGSLMVNQLEAASLAQYEEDLAAYGHEISSNLYGYQANLFGHQARRQSGMSVPLGLLAAGSSAASSYAGYQAKSPNTSPKTVATSDIMRP